MPIALPLPRFPLVVLLCGALASVGSAAQAQPAEGGNERMSQQLREAIERANGQRTPPTTRPAKGQPPPVAPIPSVTVNVGQGGALRVVPTPPTAPSAQRAASASGPSTASSASRAPAAAPARQAQAIAQDEVPPPRTAPAAAPAARAAGAAPLVNARPPARASEEQVQRQYERARAIALGLPIPVQARPPRDAAPPEERKPAGPPPPWSYRGPGGPQAWARLQPEYQLCGSGQRQSPIHIEASAALQGPNEALGFDYRPSTGTVVHDGRTIRVEVQGENLLQVRGSSWRLESFDFQHPAGEVVDHSGFAMGVHLVHRNAEGQTAIVAVLLQPGEQNPFIDRVWTYIPLDAGDMVRMPLGWLDLSALLPKDQRYYQFFGSLTQPPCTEGVLWMVLKQPVTLSAEQLRLFAQMFPANARPVQALNGRIVRDAQ
ncbi:carbonic anhydrase [Pseudorhodoferax soli]|uniref:carbonic anhydrase n=1 Tax=Pseudorhodoferax soli TaxID=545864 RepID=A0A368Y6W8_9BURK|nr:carbonic anhydrase [Pseudorhodoferax soli]